jgi:diguanylate cyclase (GGDEF)-like protein
VAIQSFDLGKFVDEVVQLIQNVFGLSSVAVFSYEAVSAELELIAYAGAELPSFEVGDKLPVDHGMVGYVARSKECCVCNDVVSDPRYRDVLVDTKSELTVPIMRDGEVLAVMNVESPRLNQFDRSDVEIFERIADQIAYTITNAELFRQKTSAHNLLLGLNELSRQINSSFDLESTLVTVARELPTLAGCRLCSIFFYHEERQELELVAHNFPTEVSSDEPISLDASSNVLMGKVIELRRSIHVKDIEQELNIPNRPRYQTKSFLNILLCQEERILGVLNLTDKADGSYFSSEEFYLINSFSEHLANAVANAERYQKILQLSVTDGLTGLFVHRYFQNALSSEIARANRHDLPLSLVMLDVDDFKRFNDTYGHQVGDIVLRELALIIKRSAREYDIPTRYGGEEFGIILPSTSLNQAERFAERLRQEIADTVMVSSHHELRVTVSQGVGEHERGDEKDELIRRADLALLEAKQAGKNRVVAAGR